MSRTLRCSGSERYVPSGVRTNAEPISDACACERTWGEGGGGYGRRCDPCGVERAVRSFVPTVTPGAPALAPPPRPRPDPHPFDDAGPAARTCPGAHPTPHPIPITPRVRRACRGARGPTRTCQEISGVLPPEYLLTRARPRQCLERRIGAPDIGGGCGSDSANGGYVWFSTAPATYVQHAIALGVMAHAPARRLRR